MPIPKHQRSDSFGEFVSAESSSTHTPVAPFEGEHDILDLRDIEKKLDAKRHTQIAEAMAAEPAMAAASESVSLIDAPLVEEPASVPAPSKAPLSPPTAPTSSTSHWTGSLWNKLSAISSFGETKPRPSGTHRRPSVVRHRTATMPISGAPGFDPDSTHHWNRGQWSLSAQAEREREKQPMPVTLKDRREDTDIVVEPWHAARVQALLPRRLRLGKSWSLLYSLDQHGASLATLYNRVARALDPQQRRGAPSEAWLRGSSTAAQSAVMGSTSEPFHVGSGVDLGEAGLVLAIRDTHDNVFGAFVNEPLHISSHYYGNGECFLWKTVQRRLPAPPSATNGDATQHDDLHPDLAIEVFRWTGKNDYMVLSESDYLSVGGGDGKYGLWIDEKLDQGLSAKCPAFLNEVLCNAQESSATHAVDQGPKPPVDLLSDVVEEQARSPETGKFHCLGVEVWAVGSD
ncbi:oxidation resistance protein 1 [Malassezia equina]|uniref:Oxidation resistance protein 1 n=1 Tax=Malassezia equina TaxID=1381935 RepID=A0AAF0EGL4_9BASI|nr:oxidation resistance protein 1 [Malassezia equina]